MEIWTAFALGIIGSLHCAVMCGPLALALPATAVKPGAFAMGRLAYNFGRLLTYCVLGAISGGIGQGLAAAGLQRWLSVGAGAAVLAGGIMSSRNGLGIPAWTAVAWVKSGLGTLLRRRSVGTKFLFGSLNGLLPCGLVYVALAGATASGDFFGGIAYMFAFGLGTIPMMLGIGLGRPGLRRVFPVHWPRLMPISVGVVGVLLILRGMSLGIPFLSPEATSASVTCPACF
jgi:sulfite exporter TauE/SafE